MIGLKGGLGRYLMKDEEGQVAIKKYILQLLSCSPRRTAHIANAFGKDFQDKHRKAIVSLVYDDRICIVKDGYYELL